MDGLLAGVGWTWIVAGIWGLVRPDSARRRLERSLRRKLRWVALLILTAGGGTLCLEAFRVAGWAGTALGGLGVVSLVNGLALLRARSTEWLATWWGTRPIWVYRVASIATIVAGAGLQWWTRAEPAARGG